MKVYMHLDFEERVKIVIYQGEGLTAGEIAAELGRDRSTISREIKRNTDPETGRYVARQAQHIYKKRIRTPQGRIRDKTVQEYVVNKTNIKWSPERISGRIQEELHGKKISHETVYGFIYKERPELRINLPRHHMKRHMFGKRKTHTKTHIPNRVLIDFRPKYIEERKQIGHWESDTMMGLKRKNSGLTFAVERMTRLVKIRKANKITAECNRKNIMGSLITVPEVARRSITYDNGKENVEHEKINERFGCRSFFCHEGSPYEKGTVENMIGLARRIYPKGTDFDKISNARVQELEDWLNNLPRKCLNWKTPNEVFRQLCCT